MCSSDLKKVTTTPAVRVEVASFPYTIAPTLAQIRWPVGVYQSGLGLDAFTNGTYYVDWVSSWDPAGNYTVYLERWPANQVGCYQAIPTMVPYQSSVSGAVSVPFDGFDLTGQYYFSYQIRIEGLDAPAPSQWCGVTFA